ncbi:GntR family transcriptional regulator [Kineosporia succinea]|uniref:DNA-binding GntR family transcriptional regulator n=1 Tax=Kineosporia succinea TaxID=84632 RepID=A0ABT9PC83_9ACTN|nr:GntR family transcriptional regulator [Kineosporia succinea]MDP9830322.1 DNA-binding GntR family transcriptional regulator [Kineosporia succinea]
MAETAERAADQAYRLLRRDIVNGTIGAGERLAETDLAERYGVSRTPIRESIRRLESEGLVEVVAHRGARVVDWSEVDIAAIYDLRALVEGYAARRATSRVTTEDVSRLAKLCDEMERLTDDEGRDALERLELIRQLNSEFHGSVADIAGQHHLTAMRNIVVVAPLVFRMIHTFTRADQVRSNNHHRDLLAAFRAGDPDWAESVMKSHVHAAKSRLLELDV